MAKFATAILYVYKQQLGASIKKMKMKYSFCR